MLGRLTAAFLVVIVLVVGGPIAGSWYLKQQAGRIALPPLPVSANSVVLDSAGKVLGVIPATNSRVTLAPDKMPALLKMAHLAAEDRDYFVHGPISQIDMLRAFVADLRQHAFVQGGSTITQQYVKNAYLSQQKTVARKLDDVLYAYRAEQQFGKDTILANYLNTNYYGRGAYGIQSAARAWFGVSASQISDSNNPRDVARAAFLAALVQQPSYFAEFAPGHPDQLLHLQQLNARVRYVLDGLLAVKGLAAHHMTPVSASVIAAAKQLLPLSITNTASIASQGHSADPQLVSYVQAWLVAWQEQLAQQNGLSAQQGQNNANALLAQGGLHIQTTISHNLQTTLDQAVADRLPGNGLSSGIVILDPVTGAVRAMYSGTNSVQSSFNNALYGRRQVGSAMKPVVLADAVSHGISAKSVFAAPAYIQLPNADGSSTKIWSDDHAAGPNCRYSLADALAVSNNPVYEELITGKMADCGDPAKLSDITPNYPVSPSSVAALAHKMGADDSLVPGATNPARIDAVPSLALGTSSLTPLKMAVIGATLDNGGLHVAPVLVQKVTSSDGTTLYQHQTQSNRVLDTNTATIVNQAMVGVFTHGTAAGARVPGHPLAGKTGTTDTDAWMLAYSPVDLSGKVPAYVCSAWAGYPKGQTTNGSNGGLWGADVARVCQKFLQGALSGQPKVDFPPADMSSGQLVGLGSLQREGHEPNRPLAEILARGHT